MARAQPASTAQKKPTKTPTKTPTSPPDDAAREERDQTITRLLEQRRKDPRDAEAAATLARLYFEKRWWSPGLEQLRAAARLDPARKADPVLLGHAVSALGNDKARSDASKVLRELGPAAKEQVRQAARAHPSARVRKRAGDLLRTWTCRGFFCP